MAGTLKLATQRAINSNHGEKLVKTSLNPKEKRRQAATVDPKITISRNCPVCFFA
jgi:hypothetical protein